MEERRYSVFGSLIETIKAFVNGGRSSNTEKTKKLSQEGSSLADKLRAES